MIWNNHLYVGESVSLKLQKLKWRINHNAGVLGVYLISLASNPDNLLDIIPSTDLKLLGYPKRFLHIIGIAGSYDEAVELVIQIVNDTMKAQGDLDVRGFLEEDQE